MHLRVRGCLCEDLAKPPDTPHPGVRALASLEGCAAKNTMLGKNSALAQFVISFGQFFEAISINFAGGSKRLKRPNYA